MLLAAIYVPDFPAAALVRAEPELREQAVAIVEGRPPLLLVIACNRRARAAEVEIGMTQAEAEGRLSAKLHPAPLGGTKSGARETPVRRGWQIRRRAPAQEQAAHAALVDCACVFSPRVEAAAGTPDMAVLDLEGLERLFGPPRKIAQALARRAAELGLEVQVAVAGNTDAAVYAARGFAGITVIAPGEEAARLGALPVEVLFPAAPGGKRPVWNAKLETRDAELADTLARWGIHTFRALAALPETAVRQRLGEAGVRLQKLARGAGSRPLVPVAPPLRFEETLELEHPIALLEPLAIRLNHLLEQLCARLAARALAAQEIRLRLCGPRPAAVSEYVLRLPVPLVEAKVFLKLLQLELHSRPPGAPVESVFLAAEPVAPRFIQGGLFLPATPEPEKLEVLLARARGLVSRFSFPVPRFETSETFQTLTGRVGAAELLDTHRPDAFRMKPFKSVARPPSPVSRRNSVPCAQRAAAGSSFPVLRFESSETAGILTERMETAEIAERGKRNEKPETVLRRFRPPRPVQVEVQGGQPVSLFDFRAMPDATHPRRMPDQAENRNVIWAAGPWRESGEWWTKEPWSREVWDIALRQDGHIVLFRAFHDTASNQWFVEATYD